MLAHIADLGRWNGSGWNGSIGSCQHEDIPKPGFLTFLISDQDATGKIDRDIARKMFGEMKKAKKNDRQRYDPKKDRTPIPYEDVLKAIESCLNSAEQWRKSEPNQDTAAWFHQYVSQAEALIELLEGHNCGSWGGFDRLGSISQQTQRDFVTLKGRFKWLKTMR